MASDSATASGVKTMKAVVWEGKLNQMAVRNVPRPRLIALEDAIIRITSAAICGTDLHTYHGTLGSSTPPWVMGHEGVGIVVEVGSATEHFKVGDRVLIPASTNDGFYSVESSTFTAVPNQIGFGLGDELGIGGTQAEYVRVPFADDSLVSIPNNTSPDTDWLFLTDIFPTAWSGLDYARFEAGKSVAVFGCGPVGLMCIYAATLRGASEVFAIDHVRSRLDQAKALGAIPIDFSSKKKGSASQQILKVRPVGIECVVDCAGQEVALNHELVPQQNYIINEAIAIASGGGGIGLTGVYARLPTSKGVPRGDTQAAELSISIPSLWIKNLSIKGGTMMEVYYDILPRIFDMVRNGKARLGFVVSSRVRIEDAPKAYERFDKRLETKVVIEFPWKRSEEGLAEVTASGGDMEREDEGIVAKPVFRFPVNPARRSKKSRSWR